MWCSCSGAATLGQLCKYHAGLVLCCAVQSHCSIGAVALPYTQCPDWLCGAETSALGRVVSILVSRQIVPARAGHVAELRRCCIVGIKFVKPELAVHFVVQSLL